MPITKYNHRGPWQLIDISLGSYRIGKYRSAHANLLRLQFGGNNGERRGRVARAADVHAQLARVSVYGASSNTAITLYEIYLLRFHHSDKDCKKGILTEMIPIN